LPALIKATLRKQRGLFRLGLIAVGKNQPKIPFLKAILK